MSLEASENLNSEHSFYNTINLEIYRDNENKDSKLWVELVLKIGSSFRNVPVKIENWRDQILKNPEKPKHFLFSLRVIKNRKTIGVHLFPLGALVWTIFCESSATNLSLFQQFWYQSYMVYHYSFQNTSFMVISSKPIDDDISYIEAQPVIKKIPYSLKSLPKSTEISLDALTKILKNSVMEDLVSDSELKNSIFNSYSNKSIVSTKIRSSAIDIEEVN